jgi:hypothetical protein
MVAPLEHRISSVDLRQLSVKSLGPQVKEIDHDNWIRSKSLVLNTNGPRVSMVKTNPIINSNLGFEKTGVVTMKEWLFDPFFFF